MMENDRGVNANITENRKGTMDKRSMS